MYIYIVRIHLHTNRGMYNNVGHVTSCDVQGGSCDGGKYLVLALKSCIKSTARPKRPPVSVEGGEGRAGRAGEEGRERGREEREGERERRERGREGEKGERERSTSEDVISIDLYWFSMEPMMSSCILE